MTNLMNGKALLEAIQSGFNKALDAALSDGFKECKHQHYSAKFVYEVSHAIYDKFYKPPEEKSRDVILEPHLHVIGVDNNGIKESGEWMLDACITLGIQDTEHGKTRFIKQILFALESESSTGWQNFYDDFAKIVHINAGCRLYLNGLNQKKEDNAKKYMRERLDEAASLVEQTKTPQMFFCFWPSPMQSQSNEKMSFWKLLTKYPHLKIYLYEYQLQSNTFIAVET